MNEAAILKLILNRSHSGYWDWNIKEHTGHLSNELLDMFGYKPGESLSQDGGIGELKKIIFLEDYLIFEELFNQHVASKGVIHFELVLRFHHKNGTTVFTNCFGQVIEWDADGTPVKMVGCNQDITIQKKREDELIKERDILKLVLDDIPQSVYWRDINHKYLGCNVSFAKSLRAKAPEEVVGKSNFDFEHLTKEEIELYHSEDKEVLSNVLPRLHFTGQIDNYEGNRIWVDSSKVPLKDESGTPYAVLGIFSDITEHEMIKEELIRTNKLYNTLSLINELLLKINTEEELCNEVCRILTKVGGFQLAWIGKVLNNDIQPVAVSGYPIDYIQNLKLSVSTNKEGYGPTSKSIMEGKKHIYNDYLSEIDAHPWRESAINSGIKASANFPVKINNNTIGSITVYADKIGYFQSKEVLLLEEVALAISFGIDKLNRATAHKAAENKIKLLAGIIDNSKTFAGIAQFNTKNFIYLNAAVKEAFDISADEDITLLNTRQFHTADAIEKLQKTALPIMLQNGIWVGENEMLSRSGRLIPVLQTIMLHCNEFDEPEFVSTTAIDITDIKKKESELQKQANDLRSLSNHLISIREEERKIIAQEIHDELGQSLAILKMDAVWIRNHIDSDKVKLQERLKQFNEITDETVKTSRRLYNNIYPQMLEDVGLVGAIKWHAKQYYSDKDFKVRFHTILDEVQLFPGNINICLTLFRIYQECLTNILRHANATVVNVYLDISETDVSLKIQDNGKGFEIDKVDTKLHHGLLGMRERVIALNGLLTINSEINIGTNTTVSIPTNDETCKKKDIQIN